jgi:hypothetical protein
MNKSVAGPSVRTNGINSHRRVISKIHDAAGAQSVILVEVQVLRASSLARDPASLPI